MSGNPRSRKRKPDQTFKYVQQDSDGIDLTKKAEVKDTGEKDGTAPKPGKHDDSAKDKTDSDADPPPAKKMDEQQKDDKETAPSPIIRKDPFDFLSSTDRKLMETDMLEFVKRFAPSYCVPVYKTWTIPKPQAKQAVRHLVSFQSCQKLNSPTELNVFLYKQEVSLVILC